MALDLADRGAAWRTIPQPFKRRGLCLAALDKKLYCIGGMDDNDDPALEVSILDTTGEKWSDGPPLPNGKLKGFGNSACVAAGRLYVSGMSGTVWRLTEKGDAWEEAGHLASPRFFHRLVTGTGGQILALGGESEAGKLRDIEILTVK